MFLCIDLFYNSFLGERKKDSPKLREALLSAKCKSNKPPPEWKHFEMDTDYFNSETKINSINIRDSLHIDSPPKNEPLQLKSNPSPKSSPSPKSKRNSNNNSRNSLETISSEEGEKKKGILSKLFRGKKGHSFGNLLDLNMKDELKRHSENERLYTKRRSESDIRPFSIVQKNEEERKNNNIQMHLC